MSHKFLPAAGLHGVINYDVPESPFVTTREHVYENTVTRVVVPEGFRSDFASVPRFFWRVFPRLGPYARAALFHDWVYQEGQISRVRADALFLAIMERDGVPLWPRLPMYAAVRAFGWLPWVRRHGSLKHRQRLDAVGNAVGWAVWFLMWLVAGMIGSLLLVGAAKAQCTGGVCDRTLRPPINSRQLSSNTVEPPAGVRAATVRIVVNDGGGQSLGSGALVSKDGRSGYILTCAHLFGSGGGSVAVHFPAGESFAAAVKQVDRQNDLALLRIASPRAAPLRFDASAPQGPLTCCGYGGSGAFRAVRGVVAGGATPFGASSPSVVIAAAVRSGDSGGPVVDRRGVVVGVIWGVRDGRTYATYGGPLRRLLSRLAGRTNQGASGSRGPPPEARNGLISQPTAPAAACECGDRWQAVNTRLDGIEGRLEGLATNEQVVSLGAAAAEAQNRAATDRETILRRALDAGRQAASTAADDAKKYAREQVSERVSRIEFADRGWQIGVALAGALGLGGPVSLVAAWAMRRVGRRIERRIEQRFGGRGPGVRGGDGF